MPCEVIQQVNYPGHQQQMPDTLTFADCHWQEIQDNLDELENNDDDDETYHQPNEDDSTNIVDDVLSFDGSKDSGSDDDDDDQHGMGVKPPDAPINQNQDMGLLEDDNDECASTNEEHASMNDDSSHQSIPVDEPPEPIKNM